MIALGGKNGFEGSNEYIAALHALTTEPTVYPKGVQLTDPEF